ncbi:hypothetical protein CHS0354_002227 [Potamilus streckersoni]|uniref:Uncharacterized protein n=1 Tax=Potamilus streckersoni TaxID=2493646 RepID=A0AAE0TBF0_9BIVA|nr:hypothetical protein CHS0354_002227 [Potamilus streckersoni]
MDSVGKDCKELKHAYENCFNEWFSESFLKGKKDDPCAELFRTYQECIKKAIKEKNLNLWELQRDVLGTSSEKAAPTSKS